MRSTLCNIQRGEKCSIVDSKTQPTKLKWQQVIHIFLTANGSETNYSQRGWGWSARSRLRELEHYSLFLIKCTTVERKKNNNAWMQLCCVNGALNGQVLSLQLPVNSVWCGQQQRAKGWHSYVSSLTFPIVCMWLVCYTLMALQGWEQGVSCWNRLESSDHEKKRMMIIKKNKIIVVLLK